MEEFQPGSDTIKQRVEQKILSKMITRGKKLENNLTFLLKAYVKNTEKEKHIT